MYKGYYSITKIAFVNYKYKFFKKPKKRTSVN